MNSSIKETLIGNTLLFVCCIFYLAWWLVAFRPDYTANKAVCTVLLVFAFVFGLAALYAVIHGMNALDIRKMNMHTGAIVAGGITFYVVALLMTWLVMNRPVTSELFLIVGWAVLEFCLVNDYYGTGYLPYKVAIALAIMVGILVIVSMICYSTYYHLEAQGRYINGMIPLISIGISLLVIIGCVWHYLRKL